MHSANTLCTRVSPTYSYSLRCLCGSSICLYSWSGEFCSSGSSLFEFGEDSRPQNSGDCVTSIFTSESSLCSNSLSSWQLCASDPLWFKFRVRGDVSKRWGEHSCVSQESFGEILWLEARATSLHTWYFFETTYCIKTIAAKSDNILVSLPEDVLTAYLLWWLQGAVSRAWVQERSW